MDLEIKTNRDKEYERRKEKIPCPFCSNVYSRSSHTHHKKVCKKRPRFYKET